ncbi:hypothetical protein [Dethiobacter alkaliphilus]|nr:hypothetical protein [Dethiobacter alkaliphilus]
MSNLQQRIIKVQNRLKQASAKAGRSDVRLIAVTKTVSQRWRARLWSWA